MGVISLSSLKKKNDLHSLVKDFTWTYQSWLMPVYHNSALGALASFHNWAGSVPAGSQQSRMQLPWHWNTQQLHNCHGVSADWGTHGGEAAGESFNKHMQKQNQQ